MRSLAVRLRSWWLPSVAALALAASAATAASAARVRTFHDGAGEIAGAPDIGKVTVTQDDDVLTVDAAVTDLPLFKEGTALFELNTDDDAATGDLGGADYVLFFDLKTWAGSVERWNGSRYVPAKKVSDPAQTVLGGGSIGFKFSLANFGWPKQIKLSVIVARGSVQDGLLDRAPDAGGWSFSVTPAMETLDLDFAPTPPHSGAVFAYTAGSAELALSDKTTVAPRTLSCSARLAGARLIGLGRGDSCRWRIPAGSAGKLLTVDATAAYAGSSSDFGTWKFRVV
jgi:hypothetical protein